MAGEENFLSRWSRRKSQSRDPALTVPAAPERETPPAVAQPQALPEERVPLPPVESLTPESDFAPFMAADVDGAVRRQALKTLFSDPRYNVMDMMDVYVDDYSAPDPLPESWLKKLEQVSRLGDRAGRDREETQRRKDLAEAQEADADAAAHTPAEPAPPVVAAPALGDENGDPAPGAVMPTRDAGDSGA